MSFVPQVLNAIKGNVDYTARLAPAYPQVPKHEVDAGMLHAADTSGQPAQSADMLGHRLERDVQNNSIRVRNPTSAKHGAFYTLPAAINQKQIGPDFVKRALPGNDDLGAINAHDHRVVSTVLPGTSTPSVFVGRVDADPEHPIASAAPRTMFVEQRPAAVNKESVVSTSGVTISWVWIIAGAAAGGLFLYLKYGQARPTTGHISELGLTDLRPAPSVAKNVTAVSGRVLA